MQSRLTDLGATQTRLSAGWSLVLTEADACALPSAIAPSAQFIPAPVPGTVAEALERAGLFDRHAPQPLDRQDAWYQRRMTDSAPGPVILRFAGLATIAEVFLNDQKILGSDSMFERHDVAVTLIGGDTLSICFRALAPHLKKTGPRARWRPQMMDSQGLRLIRTTALGHMPGWCPEIHAIGPWRPVSLIRPAPGSVCFPLENGAEPGKNGTLRILPVRAKPRSTTPAEISLSARSGDENAAAPHDTSGLAVCDLSIRAGLDESGAGILQVSFFADPQNESLHLLCGAGAQKFRIDAQGRHCAELQLPDVEPWWPRSHGNPRLYDVILQIGDSAYVLARTGFRRIAIDRGDDGLDFALVVNGERIFCRGAVWTTADIVRLPGDGPDYRPWLELAAEAGMNMIRIGGTMAYETPAFFEACDALGLMVWQDLMLANFDYPANDAAFLAHLETEIRQFFDGVQAAPSLAVVCGGSEIFQQGAMLGLPERIWKGPLCEEFLPALLGRIAPDLPNVTNSPSGGAMPFAPNAGVAHYYGVGAYCRPLDDARRANLRFAAESLAFAHVPRQQTLDAHLPGVTPLQDPRWKARVPRDRGASWDFEDVREHYLTTLYGLDPQKLRREQPGAYLDFSRAVTAEVTEASFAEWRRPQSSCNGALVWTLQDLLPGAGWGVIDSTGQPKLVWYALKRAFRPVQVLLSDEGTNGLDLHLLNETAEPMTLDLELTCLRAGQHAVVGGRLELLLVARESRTLAATSMFGAFFDTTYAYRFGPPAHDVTVARLRHRGAVIAEAFHFPIGRAAALTPAKITVALLEQDGNWLLELGTDRLAQSVEIDVAGFAAEDSGFHLAPGVAKRIGLKHLPLTPAEQTPTGDVRALGSDALFRF